MGGGNWRGKQAWEGSGEQAGSVGESGVCKGLAGSGGLTSSMGQLEG